MANKVLQFIISAKDEATAVFGKLFGFLDSEVSVVAGAIRDAFTNLFGGAVDGAIELEKRLSEVQAKGGFTADEMIQLRAVARDVGVEFGLTGKEAADAMVALAAAGLNTTQVMQALPSVLRLAAVEGLSLDQAAERVTESLAVLGLGFDQAARLSDVLAQSANISTASALGLAESLIEAGGIARTAGLDLEQTAAALTLLATAGIQGSKAGTSLAAILTQLLNPASQASRELNKLGITSRELDEVISQLAAAGPEANAAILAFGETAGPGLRALIGAGTTGLVDMSARLRDSEGAAASAAEAVENNLAGALATLGAAWSNIKIALLDPVLQPLADAARDAAAALQNNLNANAIQPVQDAIKNFVTSAIQNTREFLAEFDFQVALEKLKNFAAGAAETFATITSVGKIAADTISLAWNGLTAGFKTVGAALLATASSAVNTLAEIERAAANIGLGSIERANALKQTAVELGTRALEIGASVAAEGENIRASFGRLTDAALGAGDGMDQAAVSADRLKESLPVQELEKASKSLADLELAAARANAGLEWAAENFAAGRIRAQEYGDAMLAAAQANLDLETAQRASTESARAAVDQSTRLRVEQSSATAAIQSTVDAQTAYRSELERVATAQLDGLRVEIDLAKAKGNTATAALKSVELAKLENQWAITLSKWKAIELTAQIRLTEAKLAELAAIENKTAAQQAEISTMRLRIQALQLEIDLEGQRQGLLQKQRNAIQINIQQTQQQAEKTQQNTQSIKENSAATEENVKHTNDSSAALARTAAWLQHAREKMDELSEATTRLFEVELNSALARGGIEVDTAARVAAVRAYKDGVDAASASVAALSGEIAQAEAVIDTWTSALAFAGTTFQVWDAAIQLAAGKAKKAFYEQALAAEVAAQGIEEAFSASSFSLDQAADNADRVARGMSLLDEEDLSRLRAAISDARNRLAAMKEEADDARDALAKLNAEIAAERGDDEAARRLELEIEQRQRLGEAEKQLEDARSAGNRELIRLYEEQQTKLTQLYRLKEQNLEADLQAEQTGERTRSKISQVADEAERAERALGRLGQASLGGLLDQSSRLTSQFRTLNELL